MSYTYFDLAEIEAAMRKMRETDLPVQLASTEDAYTKIGYLAQDRFFEAGLAANLEMFRLLNENRDPTFVGKTIGAVVGGVILNTLSASPAPHTCWTAIIETLNIAISALGDDGHPAVRGSHVEITGTVGGRA